MENLLSGTKNLLLNFNEIKEEFVLNLTKAETNTVILEETKKEIDVLKTEMFKLRDVSTWEFRKLIETLEFYIGSILLSYASLQLCDPP